MDVVILLFVIIMTTMLVFAVLSNGLFIYCVITSKKLRTITNVFICSLSVSDMLLAGFIMPQKLHDIFHEEDFFHGIILCKMYHFFPVFVISASVYTLVSISFERHRAIISGHNRIMSYKKLTVIIIIIWMFSLAISVPTLFEYSVTVMHVTQGNTTKEHLSCGSQMSRDFSLSNASFVFVVSYAVPVILMLKNYMQVVVFVWRQGRRIRDNSGSTGHTVESFLLFKHRIRFVKMLVLVAVIFTLSWFPFFVMLVYAKATGKDASDNSAGIVNLVLIALATFSTAYNVVLYIIFNPSFRRAVSETLKCRQNVENLEVNRTNNEANTMIPESPQMNDNSAKNDNVFTVSSSYT